jgi:ribosomal protein L27
MKAFGRALLAASLSIGFVVPAASQEAKQSLTKQDSAKQSQANAPKVLTGKERLGPKWTDEQRIDNCNVPVEKRGTRPRPSACTQAATDF